MSSMDGKTAGGLKLTGGAVCGTCVTVTAGDEVPNGCFAALWGVIVMVYFTATDGAGDCRNEPAPLAGIVNIAMCPTFGAGDDSPLATTCGAFMPFGFVTCQVPADAPA